ncbi:MAG: cytidine deaminase [Filifactoraceae bacterium]
MDNKELVIKAKEAMGKAYAPYSKFYVGAAILAEDGKIYTGNNIENSSFGATICGERVALVKAISEGNRKFSKIALITSSNKLEYPCGICRQMLSEFQDDSLLIISNSDMSEIKEYKFAEIFPYSFDLWEAKQ